MFRIIKKKKKLNNPVVFTNIKPDISEDVPVRAT